MDIKLEYQDDKYIEFDLEDYIFLMGSNQEVKQKLARSLARYVTGKRLNTLEENVYGDDGISIIQDGIPFDLKRKKLYVFDGKDSIILELQNKKGSILNAKIMDCFNEEKFTKQVEQINNEILKLESLIDFAIQKDDNGLNLEFNTMTADFLVNKFLDVNYFEDGMDFPLEMLDLNKVMPYFLDLLMEDVVKNENEVWIFLINPASYLGKDQCQDVIAKLKRYSQDGKLKFFVISNQYLPLEYSLEDVGKTVVINDNLQQLPPFDVFKRSVEMYYPNELEISDQELCDRLYRVINSVGVEKIDEIYLKGKDMVLLKVLNELFQFKFTYKNLEDQLSNAEIRFLESKN